ncbi:UbiD family decarboxylase [Halobellus sp. Atlit-38R]|uniref:UbiD family decarboxylase n=1 Tax=Halobellus sp. Atlit-38R TaxID=2282131 RepID=UPI000EF23EF2|nr:UbiD family decarboxylase [Halobellus sp. Atlit-38R]RLM88511.1 UbiD family decarboxylase [Halobellus sp. Atlit-38R]
MSRPNRDVGRPPRPDGGTVAAPGPEEPAGSLRAYLAGLEAAGELNRIETPVSWNLEASAITMLANDRDDRVPVFESVTESEIPARLVGDPYRGPRNRPWARPARALGLPPDLDGEEYYERVIDRLRRPIEPTIVDDETAPCKAVIRRGSDADLFALPWPYIHAADGGRYSNLHTMVAPDPDSTWTDWSSHRAMIQDGDRASVLLLAGEQTPNLFYYRYERRDEPMPVAIAVGVEPAAQFTASMWIPTGSDEAAFAGGLKGEPIELVECTTNDLKVPASAELVIEGQILPGERLDEGPFGDYFGYMHGPRRSMPVLEVEAVTHREQPLIPFCVEGSGVGYSQNTSSTTEVACVGPDATLGLRAAGYDVERCVPWRFTPRTVYVVSTDVPRPGYLHELANFIFTTWGMLHVDFFVFVDPDVDPLSTREVLEALALYADPEEDFHQFGAEAMPKVPLNIYQTPEEKGDAETGTSKSKTAKAYIDATAGTDAAARDGARSVPDEQLRERARKILSGAGVDLSTVDLAGGPNADVDSASGGTDR